MSHENRKILYKRLLDEGKKEEAEAVLVNHPELLKEVEAKPKEKPKSKEKK